MKKLAIVIIIGFSAFSCFPDHVWPLIDCNHIIHNQSGRDLKIYTFANRSFSTYTNAMAFSIKNGEKFKTVLADRNCQNIFLNQRDSIYIVFSDNKKLGFSKSEKTDLNIINAENMVIELDNSGIRKRNNYYNYYIKPIHYEQAK